MKSETYNVEFALPDHIQAALEYGMIDADEAFTTGITDIMLHPNNYDFFPDVGNQFLVPYFMEMLKAAGNHGVSLPQILPDIIKNVKKFCDEIDMQYAIRGRESKYFPESGYRGLSGHYSEPPELAPLEHTSLLFYFLQGKLNRNTHKNPNVFENSILAPGQEKWFKVRYEAYQELLTNN